MIKVFYLWTQAAWACHTSKCFSVLFHDVITLLFPGEWRSNQPQSTAVPECADIYNQPFSLTSGTDTVLHQSDSSPHADNRPITTQESTGTKIDIFIYRQALTDLQHTVKTSLQIFRLYLRTFLRNRKRKLMSWCLWSQNPQKKLKKNKWLNNDN